MAVPVMSAGLCGAVSVCVVLLLVVQSVWQQDPVVTGLRTVPSPFWTSSFLSGNWVFGILFPSSPSLTTFLKQINPETRR